MKEEFKNFTNDVECTIKQIKLRYNGKIKKIDTIQHIEGIFLSYIVDCNLYNGLGFKIRVQPKQDIYNIIAGEIDKRLKEEIKGRLNLDYDEIGLITVHIGDMDITDIARNWEGSEVTLIRNK